jgi:hypothetical protein
VDGTVSATSAARTPISEGRTIPFRVAITITMTGVSAPAKAIIMSASASTV